MTNQIPPPRCKPNSHPEWREEYREWVVVDDSEWCAIVDDSVVSYNESESDE